MLVCRIGLQVEEGGRIEEAWLIVLYYTNSNHTVKRIDREWFPSFRNRREDEQHSQRRAFNTSM